jgi:hypothetical protein
VKHIEFPRENLNYLKYFFFRFCVQNGRTLAYLASQRGHTETLALLLSNNADVNAAANVKYSRIYN